MADRNQKGWWIHENAIRGQVARIASKWEDSTAFSAHEDMLSTSIRSAVASYGNASMACSGRVSPPRELRKAGKQSAESSERSLHGGVEYRSRRYETHLSHDCLVKPGDQARVCSVVAIRNWREQAALRRARAHMGTRPSRSCAHSAQLKAELSFRGTGG